MGRKKKSEYYSDEICRWCGKVLNLTRDLEVFEECVKEEYDDDEWEEIEFDPPMSYPDYSLCGKCAASEYFEIMRHR
jgi:hypothetical protein